MRREQIGWFFLTCIAVIINMRLLGNWDESEQYQRSHFRAATYCDIDDGCRNCPTKLMDSCSNYRLASVYNAGEPHWAEHQSSTVKLHKLTPKIYPQLTLEWCDNTCQNTICWSVMQENRPDYSGNQIDPRLSLELVLFVLLISHEAFISTIFSTHFINTRPWHDNTLVGQGGC